MHGVAAEVAEEVGMLFEHRDLVPARANSNPSTIPAGPPPTIAHLVDSVSVMSSVRLGCGPR